MSSVANASAQVIGRFRAENSDFGTRISDFKNAFHSVVGELKSECTTKINAYRSMVAEAESLVSKARTKQAQAKSQAAAASANAASTPKTIKETYTDKNGNEKTREKPNPAHAAAQQQAASAASQVQAANAALANATKLKAQLSATHSALEGMMRQLDNLSGTIDPQIERARTASERANGGLEKALRALQEYLDCDIR